MPVHQLFTLAAAGRPAQRRAVPWLHSQARYKDRTLQDTANESLPAVDVRPSVVGQGVFATRAFEPGELVGMVTGELIDNEVFEGSDYAMDMGETHVLEPVAPFRFLNHSCQPNCELWVLEHDDGGPMELSLEALTSIQAGDELTIDYAWEAEDETLQCLCGSPNCRGWIVAEHELPALRALQNADGAASEA
jgi:hypothetical protein